MIELVVRGNPVPQGRPRFFVRNRKDGGKSIGAFDPGQSKSWKETIKWQALEQGAKIMDGALRLHLAFYMPRPKSLPKKIVHHTKKPDLDNLLKAVKDALKGICYHDDAQVVMLEAAKYYGEEPHVRIILQGMEETAQ